MMITALLEKKILLEHNDEKQDGKTKFFLVSIKERERIRGKKLSSINIEKFER